MVSNAEGMYSKGFSQRKEAHPTSSTQSSFFAIVWEMWPNHEWTMGVGITGASH